MTSWTLPNDAAASQPVASLVRWSSMTGSSSAGVAAGGVDERQRRRRRLGRTDEREIEILVAQHELGGELAPVGQMHPDVGRLARDVDLACPAATRWLSERDIMSSGWSDDSDNTVRPVLSRIVALACVA